jgi:hypothetical protein
MQRKLGESIAQVEIDVNDWQARKSGRNGQGHSFGRGGTTGAGNRSDVPGRGRMQAGAGW